MLQQTQVERVLPRYEAWLKRWPTVESLAAAAPADVIREWQGLGYNRRALNLHRAATRVAAEGWPDDLTDLPGVGPYTAAAIRCFAFGEEVLPVDVNVARVLRRTGAVVQRRVRAGAHGPRRHDLHRSYPTVRILPACQLVSLSRRSRRSDATPGAVRGLVPPATRNGASPGGGSSAPTARTRCRGRSLPRARWSRRDCGRARSLARREFANRSSAGHAGVRSRSYNWVSIPIA